MRRVVRLEPQVQSLQQRRLRRLPVLSPTASPAKPADAPPRAAPATKPTDTSALIAPASSVSSRTTGRAALSTRRGGLGARAFYNAGDLKALLPALHCHLHGQRVICGICGYMRVRLYVVGRVQRLPPRAPTL